MEFLAPFLLWGLAGAAVPIALHFIGRTTPIAHRFSAMRFIQRSQKSSSRALKLRHLLVLLLRILGVALAALALARPILPDAAIPISWTVVAVLAVGLLGLAAYAREPIAAFGAVALLLSLYTAYPREQSLAERRVRGDFAIVVDQSMSMAYAEAQHTRFELARNQVDALLQSLTPDSRVALILATDVAERSLGRLSYRHEIVRKKLEEAKPAGRGLNLDRALQAAEDILRRDTSERPAFIVLLTDLQAANLNNARTALRKASGERPGSGARTPSLVIVPVGSDHARNAAVLAAQVQQTELQADSRAQLQVRLKPADPERALLIELFIDEQRVDQKLVSAEGRDIVDLELPFQTGRAGLHTGRINLPEGDRLGLDQERFFVYSAGRPASALIVEPPVTQADKGKAFFLKAALQPGDGGLNASGLACVVESPREMTAASLSKYRAVVLSEAVPLSADSWTALRKWVQDGGGLMLWAGPGAAIDNLRRYAFQDIAGQPPLLPGVLHGLTGWEKPPTLSISQPEHPILARFSPGVLAILRETQITKMLRVVPDPRDVNSNIILSAGGLPLLTEANYGRGRVLFFSIDPALESSDLPKRGEAYVTLALDSLRYLAERENNVSAQLGQALTLELLPRPTSGQVFWKKPGPGGAVTMQADSDLPAAALPSAISANAEAPLTLVVPPLDQPGIHAFSWFSAGNDVAQNRLVAVNVDATESDLARADDALVKDIFSAWKPIITPKLMNALETQAGQGRIRSQDFSAALLLLLAGLLIAESFFSNRMYASMETEPVPSKESSVSGRVPAAGGANG